MKAKDLGLMIITSKPQGWPKDLNTANLADALTDNKI